MFIFDGMKYGIHHTLECCWGVCQPEEHDIGDIYSKFCFKRSLILILFFDTYVVVSLSYVKLCEYTGGLHGHDHWGYEWYGIMILNHQFVYPSIALYWSLLSIFFIKEEGRYKVGLVGFAFSMYFFFSISLIHSHNTIFSTSVVG